MLKFAGHKTTAQIRRQCEVQGVYLDLAAYNLGHDTICVGGPVTYGPSKTGWVIFHTVNGRFWGRTPDGTQFQSDTAEHDDKPWMQALLQFFMVSK